MKVSNLNTYLTPAAVSLASFDETDIILFDESYKKNLFSPTIIHILALSYALLIGDCLVSSN